MPSRAYIDEDDGFVRIPIGLLEGEEQDRVIEDAVRQLREIDGEVAKLEPRTPDGPHDLTPADQDEV